MGDLMPEVHTKGLSGRSCTAPSFSNVLATFCSDLLDDIVHLDHVFSVERRRKNHIGRRGGFRPVFESVRYPPCDGKHVAFLHLDVLRTVPESSFTLENHDRGVVLGVNMELLLRLDPDQMSARLLVPSQVSHLHPLSPGFRR